MMFSIGRKALQMVGTADRAWSEMSGRTSGSIWRATADIGGFLTGPASHSALNPGGVQAERIHALWQLTLWLCAGVFTAIVLVLIFALLRAPRGNAGDVPEALPARESAARSWVIGASVISSLLLAALLAVDVLTDHALSRLPVADALRIEMTAHQWWWEARYMGAGETPPFAVAADLHIPVGRPVIVTLKSVDVIHTFWVPSLHGKKDMLPGRATDIMLRADKAGTYRGECAEFCGLEHALMAFSITAEAPEHYAAWQAVQQATAVAPREADALRGQQLFLSSRCAQCHTVRGTSAVGTLGPDLTHLALRPTLAAGTVPNDRGKLAAWIVDPQSLKPGSNMPSSKLAPDEVHALVAYLEGLR
jgi:cytochrome c oxidase subunit 2